MLPFQENRQRLACFFDDSTSQSTVRRYDDDLVVSCHCYVVFLADDIPTLMHRQSPFLSFSTCKPLLIRWLPVARTSVDSLTISSPVTISSLTVRDPPLASCHQNAPSLRHHQSLTACSPLIQQRSASEPLQIQNHFVTKTSLVSVISRCLLLINCSEHFSELYWCRVIEHSGSYDRLVI